MHPRAAFATGERERTRAQLNSWTRVRGENVRDNYRTISRDRDGLVAAVTVSLPA